MTPLRNAVVNSAWGRGKIDIPPGIARKLNDTTVVTSTTPVSPRFRPDLAKSMRVNNALERAKGQKLQVRDERKDAVRHNNRPRKHRLLLRNDSNRSRLSSKEVAVRSSALRNNHADSRSASNVRLRLRQMLHDP